MAVERGLQGGGMSRVTSPFVFSVLGFLCLGGGFGVAAFAVMQPVQPEFAPADAKAAPQDAETMLVYVQIKEPLAVAVAEQPVRVVVTLAVALRAPVMDLVTLKAEVETKRPALLAAMLAVAQVEVAKTAVPAELLKTLPGPLRDAVNRALGTDALPEPVEDVLIVGLVTQ